MCYRKGFAPMPPAPCFFVEWWLRGKVVTQEWVTSLAWCLGNARENEEDPKLSCRSDQAGGLGAWGQSSEFRHRELQHEAKMVPTSSKMSSRGAESFKNDAKMDPTCFPRVPWRPPCDPLTPK